VVPIRLQMFWGNPFTVVHINLHRRTGADQFVDFDLGSSSDLTMPWERIDRLDWDALIDIGGDDDGRAETEEVDVYLYELYPNGIPKRKFYRVESTQK
jgi:hypothetical protein